MAFTTWTDGQVLTHTALNANMLPTKIAELYTGSGFNASETDQDQSTTANVTLSLTSGELDNATYLLISISYYAFVNNGGGGNCSLKVERAQSGGAFSNVLADTAVAYATADGEVSSVVATITLPITLTSGEKSAGVDIKITGQAGLVGTNGTATITNLGTILRTSY